MPISIRHLSYLRHLTKVLCHVGEESRHSLHTSVYYRKYNKVLVIDVMCTLEIFLFFQWELPLKAKKCKHSLKNCVLSIQFLQQIYGIKSA